jgi:hypothetical protein
MKCWGSFREDDDGPPCFKASMRKVERCLESEFFQDL